MAVAKGRGSHREWACNECVVTPVYIATGNRDAGVAAASPVGAAALKNVFTQNKPLMSATIHYNICLQSNRDADSNPAILH